MTQKNYKNGIDRSQGTQLKSEGSISKRTFSVKEICKETGLTRKQLFDYQSIVAPIGHDKSGYKIYDEATLEKLKLIAELRKIDTPLCEISEVVTGSKVMETVIEEQILRLYERKRMIEEMIENAKDMYIKLGDWDRHTLS